MEEMYGVKQYLNRAYLSDNLIKSLQRELEELRELIYSLPSQNFSEPVIKHSGNNNAAFVAAIEKITALEEKLKNQISEYVSIKKEINEAIDSLSNPNERLILRLRFIEFKRWADIADETGYTQRHVFRIYNRAINNVRIILNPKR